MRVFVQGSLQSDGRYDTVPCTKTISIKMLLTHTSGLSYAFDQKGVINQLDKLYADRLPGNLSHAASSQAASSLTLLPLTLLLSHAASSHTAALTLLLSLPAVSRSVRTDRKRAARGRRRIVGQLL